MVGSFLTRKSHDLNSGGNVIVAPAIQPRREMNTQNDATIIRTVQDSR